MKNFSEKSAYIWIYFSVLIPTCGDRTEIENPIIAVSIFLCFWFMDVF